MFGARSETCSAHTVPLVSSEHYPGGRLRDHETNLVAKPLNTRTEPAAFSASEQTS
jgi:hypothetical protein